MTDPRLPARLVRGLALAALAAAAPGCAAVSALSGAAAPLDAYTLTPLAAVPSGRGSRHIVVEAPTTSGAIATDRILVKPNRLQAAYLPGARWVDAAPTMIQTLLVQSLQASGAYRLVSRTSMGLLPDTTLMTEIRAFEAEPGPPGGPAYVVQVALTLTVVREVDGAVVAARDLASTATAPSGDALALAVAFDAATGAVLREAVAWLAGGAGV
jgi:cholesterol transport system auxiliary component